MCSSAGRSQEVPAQPVKFIAAGGILSAPHAMRHCTCNCAVATSLALVNMPEASNWDASGARYHRAPLIASAIIRSWARRKVTSESTARFFAAWLKSYGLTKERLAEYRGNPVDNVEPLARAGVPLLHVMGDADDAVPVAKNTVILEARYKQWGGQITVIHKPGVGHHPH